MKKYYYFNGEWYTEVFPTGKCRHINDIYGDRDEVEIAKTFLWFKWVKWVSKEDIKIVEPSTIYYECKEYSKNG